MTPALSNLAALQQVMAPIGQSIGNLNAAQLAIAQEQYKRRMALEDLQRQQDFIRERDRFGEQKAIELENLRNTRYKEQTKSQNEREDTKQTEINNRQKEAEMARKREAIRKMYLDYVNSAKNAGEKPAALSEFGFDRASDFNELNNVESDILAKKAEYESAYAKKRISGIVQYNDKLSKDLQDYIKISPEEAKLASGRALGGISDPKVAAELSARIARGEQGDLLFKNIDPKYRVEFESAIQQSIADIQEKKAKSPRFQELAKLKNISALALENEIKTNPHALETLQSMSAGVPKSPQPEVKLPDPVPSPEFSWRPNPVDMRSRIQQGTDVGLSKPEAFSQALGNLSPQSAGGYKVPASVVLSNPALSLGAYAGGQLRSLMAQQPSAQEEIPQPDNTPQLAPPMTSLYQTTPANEGFYGDWSRGTTLGAGAGADVLSALRSLINSQQGGVQPNTLFGQPIGP